MIALGDWLPEEPLQGVVLTRLHGDLYDIRAVGIMSGLAPHAMPEPGVMAYQSKSEIHHAIATVAEAQIKGFAAYYGGVAVRRPTGWILKAVATKMRREYGREV